MLAGALATMRMLRTLPALCASEPLALPAAAAYNSAGCHEKAHPSEQAQEDETSRCVCVGSCLVRAVRGLSSTSSCVAPKQ